jgi:peptide/nickel transport system ATP-binding protein
LLPAGAVIEGSIRFRGRELIGEGESLLRTLRGAQISLVLQEPLLSLNPVIRVRNQVAEVVRAHANEGAAQCRKQAAAALDMVGLKGERLQTSYPHELSGGQRQRVLLAQAIVCGPSLIIADEPTGALDAAAQSEILGLLRELVRQSRCALLLITHDPRIVESIAGRVMILYGGRIVESGSAADVLQSPLHPYTRGLMRCMRDPLGRRETGQDRHLPAIPGAPPDFQLMPSGCTFEPRCADRIAPCAQAVPAVTLVASREVRCYLYGRG